MKEILIVRRFTDTILDIDTPAMGFNHAHIMYIISIPLGGGGGCIATTPWSQWSHMQLCRHPTSVQFPFCTPEYGAANYVLPKDMSSVPRLEPKTFPSLFQCSNHSTETFLYACMILCLQDNPTSLHTPIFSLFPTLHSCISKTPSTV